MSFLRRDADPHARFRALLSQRLDERLGPDDARSLRRHLLGCARCRAADRDFRAQRILLRGERTALPPRDLWARTSAALDREVARGGQSGVLPEPRRLHRSSQRVAAVSVIGMMLAVAIVGSQLSTGGQIVNAPGIAAGPTPFGVPTQELAFVGLDKAGFAIYRTEVSQVCPPLAIDCTTLVSGNRQVVTLRGQRQLRPSSVAFHPQGNKVAISAQVGRGESVYVVFLKPVAERAIDRRSTDPPRATSPLSATASTTRTPTPAPVTPTAATSAVATPAATTATPALATPATATPAVATPATATPAPSDVPAAPGTPRGSPKPTPSPAVATPPPGKTARPTPPASAPPPSDPLMPSPSTRPTTGPTAAPTEPATPVATPARTDPPASAASAGTDLTADIQPILQDVLPAGADQAWSPDGSILAFSAMPADGSHGPDIYIWRNGEQVAEQLTSDHRSYFASWAGQRIVVSRAPRVGVRADGTVQDSRVTNVVIDLETGEQRRIDASGVWLPQVDPTQRFAVVWRGTLRQDAQRLVPAVGALYLADWRRLDPFRPTGPDRISIGGAGEPGTDRSRAAAAPPTEVASTSTDASAAASASLASPSAGAPADASPAAAASPGAATAGAASPTAGSPAVGSPAVGSPAPSATSKPKRNRRPPTPASPRPSATPVATATPSPTPTPSASPAPTATPTPTTTPDAAPTPDAGADATAVEPTRDVGRNPVVDWVGRWNSAGDAYGFWVAEEAGASWGRLTILSIDRSTGRIVRDATLLGPTLAKRMFSLGQDRVAWVAPVDDQPDGELRVRTWGPNGSGTVRIRDVNAGQGVAGF